MSILKLLESLQNSESCVDITAGQCVVCEVCEECQPDCELKATMEALRDALEEIKILQSVSLSQAEALDMMERGAL